MNIFKITAIALMGLFVTACAQQEEPVVHHEVEAEKTYDKYGNEI